MNQADEISKAHMQMWKFCLKRVTCLFFQTLFSCCLSDCVELVRSQNPIRVRLRTGLFTDDDA